MSDKRLPVMLDYEAHNRRRILLQNKRHYQLANRLVKQGVSTIEDLKISSPRFGGYSQAAIGGLLARAIRQFSSIVWLSQLGYSENIEILNRSLFDNLLAVAFIVTQPKAGIVTKPQFKNVGAALRVKKDVTPADFRACLYLCYRVVKTHDEAERISRLKGFKRAISLASKNELKAGILKYQQVVGAAWIERMRKHPKSYSGMNAAELAEWCGLLKYYRTLYWVQCQKVHAGAASDHVDTSGDDGIQFELGGEWSDIPDQLHYASRYFGNILVKIIRAFRMPFPNELLRVLSEVVEYEPAD